ncbi:MAG: uroporphyrinogen-III C-methyltransferase [Roseofilum sp. Belize BBD 4]|uniref:uroporphyrinogen-III C-methyltransferase n=1 Tax=Roseofilum sp. Belize BBD 4 TaxID=2821500 RepID=UPI000E99962C|nr:uroporphyrinogen-III C-methyltransferase [Roseofilum sp. Belize BBD 4]MBP0035893.1 uroporphyrinogen-III C-methyltransferase [Roseofilum sp. Belize BBD 4]HBQ98248.1 uroporphyrinogen-III C-methyltransferase [Cyanobacteria bacterium UBA11691]
MVGKVYLVGAGLGRLDTLTLRAYTLLKQADVVIYDALVDSRLFAEVRSHCLLLDMGKRGGKPSASQSSINQALIYYCQQGNQVVRLKSGDPLIFGRSGSELQALLSQNCPVEIVPGLSSAIAAPTLAGIALTDPILSQGFTVVTAHDPSLLNWLVLAQMKTLVILMGTRQLAEIIRQLGNHGKHPDTPIAIIRWAGFPEQQIWQGRLQNIIELTAGQSLSPAVIIIGNVVEALSPNLVHFPCPMPLSHHTILVTRSAGQSSEFTQQLQQQEARVIEMPALEIVPPSSWEGLDGAIANLSTFNWLILTSSNAVDYFFQRLQHHHLDSRALAGIKIAVVGKKTAASLRQQGLQPDYIPPKFIADTLVEHFPEPLSGKSLLFPRVETGGREVLVQECTAQGARVTEVAAYQSQCPQTIPPEALNALQNGQVTVITFASSKTVKNTVQILNQTGKISLNSVCIASIGPQTSKTCEDLLGRVDIEAKEYTLDGLTEAIVQWAKNH